MYPLSSLLWLSLMLCSLTKRQGVLLTSRGEEVMLGRYAGGQRLKLDKVTSDNITQL